MKCDNCHDVFDEGQMVGKVCRWCERKLVFADFAKSMGLTRYVDPTGERYVYSLDGSCDGKKVECIDFMDELWNAMARFVGRDELTV